MKIIKLTILLAIIALSFQTERLKAETRTHRAASKKAAKAKAVRSKSRAGVPCSVANYDVTITVNGDDASKMPATFDAKELKVPTGESLRGWKFNIANLSELGKKVFSAVEGGFILRYARVSVLPASESPEGAAKNIFLTYQESATVSHSVKVSFVYDPKWDVIEDSVLAKVVFWLNTNIHKNQDLIKDLKARLIVAAEEYRQNQVTANLAGATAEAFKAEVAKQNAEIDRLNKITTQANVDLVNNNLLINQQRTKIEGLKATRLGYDTRLAQLAGTKNSIESNINKLNTDILNNNTDRNKYMDAANGALQKIDGLIATYKDECSTEGVKLDNAKAALIKDKATTGYNTLVRQALAVNN